MADMKVNRPTPVERAKMRLFFGATMVGYILAIVAVDMGSRFAPFVIVGMMFVGITTMDKKWTEEEAQEEADDLFLESVDPDDQESDGAPIVD